MVNLLLPLENPRNRAGRHAASSPRSYSQQCELLDQEAVATGCCQGYCTAWSASSLHLHLGLRAGGKVLEGRASLSLRTLGRPSGCIKIPERSKEVLESLGRVHGAATAASQNCEGVIYCITFAACDTLSMISVHLLKAQKRSGGFYCCTGDTEANQ